MVGDSCRQVSLLELYTKQRGRLHRGVPNEKKKYYSKPLNACFAAVCDCLLSKCVYQFFRFLRRREGGNVKKKNAHRRTAMRQVAEASCECACVVFYVFIFLTLWSGRLYRASGLFLIFLFAQANFIF